MMVYNKIFSLNPGLTPDEYESDLRNKERYLSSSKNKARKIKFRTVRDDLCDTDAVRCRLSKQTG